MKNSQPIWFNKKEGTTEINLSPSPYKIFVATPVHSEVSIHYTQALLKFQQDCFHRNILVSFTLYKSSLVQQGRNLCVAEMMNADKDYTHLLFIDSDIDFNSSTIFTMLEKDKDIIASPYPMKFLDWGRIQKRATDLNIKDPNELAKLGYTFPIKTENMSEIVVEDGVAEVTHAPTGCMLIKKSVIEKMIKQYPELEIKQPTLINGQEKDKPNFYNLFECLHEPDTKRYYGEDFGFCKRWTSMGGKVHLYCMDYMTHTGEYEYCGRLWDELQTQATLKKNIDESKKTK
ncbi:MAG: hypothetical protein ACPGRW_08065 [Flavobacteriaceae bacterium]